MKLLKLTYSVVAYLIFLAIFNYFIVFLGGDALAGYVPFLSDWKSVDSGDSFLAIPGLPVFLANGLLLLAFSLQHSVMARFGFKQWLTRLLPKSAERSTYVLSTCAVLAWMYLAWQPMTGTVWQIEGMLAHGLAILFLLGAGLVLWSTFMISHWELFGLSQAWHAFRGTKPVEIGFTEPAMYQYSRHPLYLGLFFVLWSTPWMTTGHLLLASIWSVYIFIGIALEERDLIRHFGQAYLDYKSRVPKLFPFLKG